MKSSQSQLNRSQAVQTTNSEPETTVGFIAFQEDGTLMILSTWTLNKWTNTATHKRQEWAWNYVKESFHFDSYSYPLEITEGTKTIEYNNKNWVDHATDSIKHTFNVRHRTDEWLQITPKQVNKLEESFENGPHFNDISDLLNEISS